MHALHPCCVESMGAIPAAILACDHPCVVECGMLFCLLAVLHACEGAPSLVEAQPIFRDASKRASVFILALFAFLRCKLQTLQTARKISCCVSKLILFSLGGTCSQAFVGSRSGC